MKDVIIRKKGEFRQAEATATGTSCCQVSNKSARDA